MENYEEYEGKEIVVVCDDIDETEIKCIVSGCDYDIGISIEAVEKEELQKRINLFGDDATYMQCLNGPASPEYNERLFIKATYHDEFNYLISQIKKGILNIKEYTELFENDSYGDMAPCPFNL